MELKKNEREKIHMHEFAKLSDALVFAENNIVLSDYFIQSSKNYMCIIGYDGAFIKLSRSFELFLGYTTEELLNEPVEKIIINPGYTGSDDFLEISTTNYYFNYCFRCKNGKIKLLRCRLLPDIRSNAICFVAWEIQSLQR